MEEDITLYCKSIDDISPVGNDSISVTLDGVDVSQIIQELTIETLLASVPREDIETYLKELDNE